MTTANIITLVRIALIPIFMILANQEGATANILALLIFALASLTDGVDGHIARKYNQVTNFGKFMDPLADKLLVMSAMLIFVEQGIMPSWAVVVILAREFMVTSLRMVAAADGLVIQASIWGKAKTVIQIFAIIVLLLKLDPIVLAGSLTLQNLCIYAMVAITVISGISYIKDNFSVIKDGFVQKGA